MNKTVAASGVFVIALVVGAWWYFNGQSFTPASSSTATSTATSTMPMPPVGIQTISNGEGYVSPKGVGLLAVPAGWSQVVQEISSGGEIAVFTSNPTDAEIPPLIIASWEPKTDNKNVEATRNELKTESTLEISADTPVTIAGATGYLLDAKLTRKGIRLDEKIYILEKDNTIFEIIAIANEGNAGQKTQLEAILKTLKLTR